LILICEEVNCSSLRVWSVTLRAAKPVATCQSVFTANSSSTGTVRYGAPDVHGIHVSAPMISKLHYARVNRADNVKVVSARSAASA